jgi:hypothetical protein
MFCSNNYDWIRNPFEKDRPASESLTFAQSEELSELSCSKSLEQQFRSQSMKTFWISLSSEFLQLANLATKALIPFATTYLCEVTFSAVTALKTKSRNRLDVETISEFPCLQLNQKSINFVKRNKHTHPINSAVEDVNVNIGKYY